MPYELKKSVAGGKPGYRVFKKGTREAYSKEALPMERAKKQMAALYRAEGLKRKGKK
jgi:hypothetical protein